MRYIDTKDELANIVESIPKAETFKVAVVRPTTRFEVVTGDNEDMKRTLEDQKKYVKKKLNKLSGSFNKEEKTKEFEREFQKNLSKKAAEEQNGLLKKLKEHGIRQVHITEDKGVLESEKYEFYTDQIFATDTGQFYTGDEGQLNFIRASFKNKQRQGEERLAAAQAENLGAKVQTLTSEDGRKLTFEGGDIRQMVGRKLFFIGGGAGEQFRTEPLARKAIAEASGYYVIPVELLQPQFYHLDCCFMPLPMDSAVIYEGEYELDKAGNQILDTNGWPKLIPGTETMTADSRALIRTIYSNDKLVLISKNEALAFATNAALLESTTDKRQKLFVNGDRSSISENKASPMSDGLRFMLRPLIWVMKPLLSIIKPFLPISKEAKAIKKHEISFTRENLEAMRRVTEGEMDIVEVPYKTMHLSGGSVRCTVNEMACTTDALTLTHKKNKHYFSDRIDQLEKQRHYKKLFAPNEVVEEQVEDNDNKNSGYWSA